jgi:hypothetical protein
MNASKAVSYWHPTKGGWHVGEEVTRDAKVVVIKPCGNARKLQVPVEDVKAIEEKAA